ncbi:hypothetical protein EMCRGX_G008637 [Ephydatia muelleri]|eukprot:Em0003g40a
MSKRDVLRVFKQLLYLGRDWPQGYTFFRQRVKNAFLRNKSVSDPQTIKELTGKAEYVLKEIDALYKLKKYRTLKRRYYDGTPK